jgi:hypothetical protein
MAAAVPADERLGRRSYGDIDPTFDFVDIASHFTESVVEVATHPVRVRQRLLFDDALPGVLIRHLGQNRVLPRVELRADDVFCLRGHREEQAEK